ITRAVAFQAEFHHTFAWANKDFRAPRPTLLHCRQHVFAIRRQIELHAERSAAQFEDRRRHGCTGGPSIGVFTGAARPTNSVNVSAPEFDSHRFPEASIASPYGSLSGASSP